MLIDTALVLQSFNPELADPSYDLTLQSTLTVKPVNFFMRVHRRPRKILQHRCPKQNSTSKA